MAGYISKLMEALSSKRTENKNYVVNKTSESMIIKIGNGECLGLRFIILNDPLNSLSSSHINKIEQYMYRFSTFLSMLHDDVIVMYTKISEQYDIIIRRIESKINKLRIMIELGSNDVRKIRELKVLERIHENLLNSKNVYRLLLLLIIRVIDKCDNIEETLEERTKNLFSLINSYLDLKPQLMKPDEILKRFNVIPLPNGRMLIDKRKTILIVGDGGAVFLPFNRNYVSVFDIDLSGVYIGYEITTNRPLILSPEKHLKFHGIIIGPTGKGKTTLLASMFIRINSLNYKVIAIDFKGDMSRYLNGYTQILNNLSLKKLIEEYKRKSLDVNKWIFSVSKIWSRVLDLKKSESYILFKALQQVVKENEDLSLISRYIDSFYIKSKIDSDVYDRIIESVELLRSEDSFHTIDINKSYVLNLEQYPDYIKELFSSIILSFEMNMNKPFMKFNKLVLVDEAWRLKKIRPNILSALYREGRSLGIGVFSSSQLLRDLPNAVIENSHTFVIFGSQSKDYIDDIRSSFDLTNKELEKLSNLKVGEVAIILKDSKRPIWVRIVPEAIFNE